MNHDLITLSVACQNVLNSPYAITKLEKRLAPGGLQFEGETIFTKTQVAEVLTINERTIDRYLASSGDRVG